MDPNQLIQMLMELMQTPPNEPAGSVPRTTPAQSVPPQIANDDPLAGLLQLLMSQVSNVQAGAGATNSMRGAQGHQGGMYGSMGGRPRGS